MYQSIFLNRRRAMPDAISCSSALEEAWPLMIEWFETGKFIPTQDIQCILHYGIVNELGTAEAVHPKPTFFSSEAGSRVKAMHFRDFLACDHKSIADGAKNIVLEIKFVRSGACERRHRGDARRSEDAGRDRGGGGEVATGGGRIARARKP
jgi:hypothetical protein